MVTDSSRTSLPAENKYGSHAVTRRTDDNLAIRAAKFVREASGIDEGAALSTAAVYAEFDRLNEGVDVPESEVSAALMTALRAGDAEPAVSLRPELVGTLDVSPKYDALGAFHSGSGQIAMFFVRDKSHALGTVFLLTSS